MSKPIYDITVQQAAERAHQAEIICRLMETKDGDVQVISTLMDELAGNAPAGAYECAVERLSRRGYSFPKSAELKALLTGDIDAH